MVTTVSGGLSRCGVFSFCFPLPREQFVQTGSCDLRDAAEDVGEPELGIDLVEARGHDEGEHDGGPVRAAVGSSEQPGLSAQSQSAQAPFGRVVGQTNATIVDESGEAVPALQHIINRLENVGRARELVALLTQPGFQLDE